MAGWIGRLGARRFRLLGGARLGGARLVAVAVISVTPVIAVAAVSPPAASAQTSPARAACTRAAALVAEGYLTAAENLLKANLGATDPCVTRELRRVFAAQRATTPTPVFENRLRAIRGLIAAGFAPEAQKQIQALVEANPNRPIPADLRAYNQRLAWWQLILDTGGPVIRTALEMVIGLLALIVIVLLAAQLAGGLYRRRWPATYMIGTVTGMPSSDSSEHTELLKVELTGLSNATYGDGPVAAGLDGGAGNRNPVGGHERDSADATARGFGHPPGPAPPAQIDEGQPGRATCRSDTRTGAHGSGGHT